MLRNLKELGFERHTHWLLSERLSNCATLLLGRFRWYESHICKAISHETTNWNWVENTHVKIVWAKLSLEKHLPTWSSLNLVGKHALGSELAKNIISNWQCSCQTHSHHILVLFLPLGPIWTQLNYPLNLICVLPFPLFIPLHLSPLFLTSCHCWARYFLRPRTRGKKK